MEDKTVHRFSGLQTGTLVRRYKRFLADVRTPCGRLITAFTPNSGSMMTCSEPGSPVMLSHNPGPGRKTEFTLEMVMSGDTWVGVNTLLANRLAATIVDRGFLAGTPLDGYSVEKTEYRFGHSRLDLLLSGARGRCLAEVKNVTLQKDDAALFPDAVTTRGLKHLHSLIRALSDGYCSAMIYIVQRSDCTRFCPAAAVDRDYAEGLRAAVGAGVAVIPIRLEVTPEHISFVDILPVQL